MRGKGGEGGGVFLDRRGGGVVSRGALVNRRVVEGGGRVVEIGGGWRGGG